MKTILFCLFPIFLFSSLNDKEKVVNYLLKKYPVKDPISEHDLIYYPEVPVERLNAPFIEKKWGIKFFTTTLLTGYYEYMDLNVLLSINDKSKIYMMPSPSFTGSEDVSWQFGDTELDNEEDKHKFIQELGWLISKIMYEGQAKDIRVETDCLSIKLYENSRHYRTLKTFYQGKKLKYVQISNPREN